MWSISERMYMTRYDKRNTVMVRRNQDSDKIEFYMQNEEEGSWQFCFALDWNDVTEVTGETVADWHHMVGIDALVRAYRSNLKPFESDKGKFFARQVDAADFFPADDLTYSLSHSELVRLDATIEHIIIQPAVDGGESDTATVLLRDRTGSMVGFVDKELYPEFIHSFKENQRVQAVGRVYLPMEVEEGTPANLDILELHFR